MARKNKCDSPNPLEPDRAASLARFPEENPDPVLRMSAAGRILYCNPAAAKLAKWMGGDGVPLDQSLLPVVARAMTEQRAVQQDVELESRWYSISAVPVAPEGYVNLYAHDVTERRRSENALHESEERYRTLFETAPDGIVVHRDGRFLHANTEALRLTGARDFAELADHFVLDFFRPQDRDQARERMRAVMAGNRLPMREATLVCLDGREIIVEFHTAPLDFHGSPAVLTVIRDITERQQAEESLRESEERFRVMADGIPQMIWATDAAGRMQFVNRAYTEFFGVGLEQVRSGGWQPLLHPEDETAYVQEYMACLRDQRVFHCEARVQRHDGQWRWVESFGQPRLSPSGAFLGIVGSSPDITKRVQMERSLRRSEERLRLAQQAARVGAFEWDIPNDVNRWTPELEAIYGLPSGAFAGTQKAWEQLVHPEDREKTVRQVAEAFETAAPTEGEWRVVWPDGSVHWVAGRWQVFKDPSGNPVRMTGINMDISARRRAEEALRELNATLESKVAARTEELAKQRQRLYEVLEAIPAMVCLLTPDYHVAFANRSFRRVFGEPDGRHCYEFCYGRTEPCEFCETYHVLKTGRPHRWEVTSADGRTIMDAHDYPFTDVDGSPLILEMDIDITERKRAEAALRELNETLSHRARQLQKLTLELTQAEERERRRIALILHEDLQQQIAGAKFHLSMIRGRTRDDRQRTEIDHIGEMLTNAIEESRRLSHDLSPAVLHMNDLAEALRWLSHRIRTQYGLVVRLDPSDEITLPSEALTIFLFRAAQEMLFNVARHARIPEAILRVRRLGRYVGLHVADQGRGFDPRELRETSGFGLFSLRERTELLGGRLRIRSAPGRGSRLRLVVPDGRRAKDNHRPADSVDAPRGVSPVVHAPVAVDALRVLLVDDHEIVRQGLVSLLQELPDIAVAGQAANGREAVSLAHALRPDVVVMDVYMPLMSGEEATRQIKKHLPQTRVIALSMHDEPDKREMMLLAGAESYVLKTASPEELCAAIRRPQPAAQEDPRRLRT